VSVLDPRTRLVPLKLLKKGPIRATHRCVSIVKEANVYRASAEGSTDLAVQAFKTFKTSGEVLRPSH
jgi:serine/threonine-protein kinase RIO1